MKKWIKGSLVFLAGGVTFTVVLLAVMLRADERKYYYVQQYDGTTLPLVLEMVDRQGCQDLRTTTHDIRAQTRLAVETAEPVCVPKNSQRRNDLVQAEQTGASRARAKQPASD
ncbi:hypothetical protein QTH97_02260 [Variovorax sp. J22R24]|uniref:hypothetical protein n=1 Tax=Variovorax gracilis TaxID=3053502 RepID=UPI002578B5CF|nr:hypothetical protein [Variovorax sp. J22R24]MDM0103740.1 hypothetical protein [Variovorax sp. J22R24]